MSQSVPFVNLNNGTKIPQFGLGTWKSKTGEVSSAVTHALSAGYRHIDCAFAYGNEKEVGAALSQKLADGSVKREDLYVTTKLWNTFHRESDPPHILRKQLADLQLEYVDLYLVHWPMAYVEDRESFPKGEDGKFIFSTAVKDIMETWRGMEACVEAGLAKSIGLSNFNSEQIQKIMDQGKIKPVMLQVELNPYFSQRRLVQFCTERDIAVTAYSPLGSPDRPWAKPEDPVLLDDPALKTVANKYSKSPAQVVLRWAIQRGLIVIPKSVTPARLDQNIDIFDFELSADDMKVVDGFNRDWRSCVLEWVAHHPDYPFHIEF